MDARADQANPSSIEALTSIRFFAALCVLLYHSGGPAISSLSATPEAVKNFFANGYLGVTFFFVLSGFILTHVYFGKLHNGRAVQQYALARFARIYPVYLLALLLATPFAPADDFWRIAPQFFLLQLWFPPEFHFWPANWNMQSWTLSAELFFM